MSLLRTTVCSSVLASLSVLGAGCYVKSTTVASSSGVPAQISAKYLEAKDVEPATVESKGVEPRVVESTGIEPQAVEPTGIEPKVVEPEVVEPKAVEPKVEEPKGTDPVGSKATPLDLTNYYSMKAANFDKMTQYPWPGVPRGSHTFASVPVEIGGALVLWGERNANNGQKYPEEIKGIPIKRKFETLYVCHAAFFEAKSGTPMCQTRFQYADGASAFDEIVCGEDARDWYADRSEKNLGPTGPNSTLAWDGDAKYRDDRVQAIRFCLTAIKNPHPDKVVTALDLVSSKTQTAACIIAIITGQAGLLKAKAAAPATDE